MRAVIAAAPVGDDQLGEDPTANELQERVAALLGKQAALWLPTGTMANQAALRVLTSPGDDVIVSRESHVVWHESGAGAANSGIQFHTEEVVLVKIVQVAAITAERHRHLPPSGGQAVGSLYSMHVAVLQQGEHAVRHVAKRGLQLGNLGLKLSNPVPEPALGRQ